METLANYRNVIKTLLERYSPPDTDKEPIEIQVITDTERDHYQLVHVGWQNDRRIYGCVLHMDIKDDKIWIQHDGTEVGMANELVAAGIPKDRIVLGFQSPFKRQFTDFAVG